MELEEKIESFLNKYDLADKTIIVGFSGGYDSMCLLDILSNIKNTGKYEDLKIVAAHFNHNWRGEEALREQEVCRLFASSKGFEFYTRTASNDIKKNENAARIVRYEFFEEAMENYDADAVFTAHNRDDNAETVLYRVIKGTGLVGLKGISERRGNFYRPLLRTNRSEIVNYCEAHNLNPNNDSSNGDIKYKRNFLRLNVIPFLEKINPNVKESLNTLAEVAANENNIIEEYLEGIKKKIFDGDKINPVEYSKLSYPVKMRILHEYIQILGLDYDYKKIKEIYEFIEQNITKRNGSTISLATSLWLYVDDKMIDVIPPRKKTTEKIFETVEITGEGEYHIGGKTVTLKKYEDKEIFVFPESTSNFAYIDLSQIRLPITLRTRQDGDIISPFGMKGTMKLKKYFNSKGVNRHIRDDIILVTKGNEILWAAGVGLSDKIGVTKTPTHVIEII